MSWVSTAVTARHNPPIILSAWKEMESARINFILNKRYPSVQNTTPDHPTIDMANFILLTPIIF